MGHRSPSGAIGTQVKFIADYGDLVAASSGNKVAKPVELNLLVVGIVSGNYMPAGAPGALAPYGVVRSYWSALAQPNGRKGGEDSSRSPLGESRLSVGTLGSRRVS